MHHENKKVNQTTSEQSQKQKWPEEESNFVSRWSYTYMNPLLSKGSYETLEHDDLWNIPPNLNSPQLLKKFNSIPNELPLWKKLYFIASECFLPAGVFQLITITCQCLSPIIGREVIRLLESSPENLMKQGIVYGFVMFFTAVINGIATQRYLFLSMQAGMMVRTTAVSAIYAAALKLSPTGKVGLTSGEVVNLVSVDSQKLYDVMQDGHMIWSCPLSMLIVMSLLIYVQGPVTIVGTMILILMLPLMKIIVSKMQKARKERVKYSDKRIETATAMINGIEITKLNSYEKKFEKKIAEKRRLEMKYLSKELIAFAWTQVCTVCAPMLATGGTFIVYVFLDDRNILRASDTFTTLMLFSALRFPINYVGRLTGRIGQSLDACRRISDFLSRDILIEGDEKQSKTTLDTNNVVIVKDGTFQIVSPPKEFTIGDQLKKNERDGMKPEFTLTGINFALDRGQILAVIGPVGSGKSTLALSLIGEIQSSVKTSLNISGRIGFSSQIPFILNATLRENILFGSNFDPVRYNQVIHACCLESDIKLLPAGDLTEIGERGVTLSGGQKQRLSIARTVYTKPDVAIFDDPLSALDAGTAKALWERLFAAKKIDNLLSSTAVILVTHSTSCLNEVDQIMILEEGKNIFHGTWNELIASEEKKNNSFLKTLTKEVEENKSNQKLKSSDTVPATFDIQKKLGKKNSQEAALMTVEEREFGISSISTWKVWFKGAGGWPFALFQFILLAMDRSAYIATEWWLAQWTEADNGPITLFGKKLPSQLDGIEAQMKYVSVYVIIICISIASTASRSIWVVLGGARCARRLFDQMTLRVLQAPMSYFNTTPLGRILNRFTYDTEVLDIELTQAISIGIISLSWFVAGVSVMTSILPWLILVIIPIVVVFVLVQLHYRKSSIDLQRLDAISRSPLQTTLSEVMDGAITIRVFEQQNKFTTKFFNYMDQNNIAMLTFIAAYRWVSLRIEMMSAIIQFAAILLVSMLQQTSTIQPGLAGMLIIWTFNFTFTFSYLIEASSEAEAAITSVERILTMTTLPQEKSVKNGKAPKNWPREGSLVFKDVFMRYRENLPYALKGLTLELASGLRCGVVGRTGAGKSSLAVALFRLVEIESGTISFDGVDLSTLNLSEIRGRSGCMSIIPQDPVLFSGSVRDCLDPFNEWSDNEVLEALNAVRLLKDDRGDKALNDHVEEGGSNFSVGERQLLCLARALLAKPKFLVLDEATASVDRETDMFIQNMLRTRFQGCTLLTIAHRLNTIMDYDIIIAMENGRVAEMGSPNELLQNKKGLFTKLVDSTGKESAAYLRSMLK